MHKHVVATLELQQDRASWASWRNVKGGPGTICPVGLRMIFEFPHKVDRVDIVVRDKATKHSLPVVYHPAVSSWLFGGGLTERHVTIPCSVDRWAAEQKLDTNKTYHVELHY